MTMETVRSSNIAAIGYDAVSQKLRIQFHSGQTWEYSGVSERTYEALMSAPSVGVYVNREVKGKYAGSRV